MIEINPNSPLNGQIGTPHTVRPSEPRPPVEVRAGSGSPAPKVEGDPIKRASDELNRLVANDSEPKTRLRIELNEESGRFIIQSINEETGEVISQFPPKEVIAVIKYFREIEGLAVDAEV